MTTATALQAVNWWGPVVGGDEMSSAVARAVEYPSGGRAATTPAHETIDAAPPRHTRTRGRASSSGRVRGAHPDEPWWRVALRIAGLLRVTRCIEARPGA